jgi:hypothetical protein
VSGAARSAAGQPVGGICMVRDALDIAPFLCGHYLRLGFDRLVFIDDGSEDGTFEFLQRLARREPRIEVERLDLPYYSDPRPVTDATCRLIADGVRLVFPFDSDEFWNIDLAAVRRLCCSTPAGQLVGRWVQFVQLRETLVPTRLSLLRVRHRAPELVGPMAAGGSSLPFLCHRAPKIAVKADAPVAYRKGYHTLESGPSDVLADDLEVFHIPLRSRQALHVRALQADRVLQKAQIGESWQSARFRLAEAEGQLDAVWAAHSADGDGVLAAEGGAIILVPDARFRAAMQRALLYMAAHHPGPLLAWRSALASQTR